jgi:AcrR family transcriptional regulator
MVIVRDGYRPAKMAAIAQLSGVSIGTLYNYFDNKEALFNALREHHRTQFLAYVEQPYDSDDPLMQLRQLVSRAYEFAEQHRALFNLYVRANALDIDMGSGSMQDPATPDEQHRIEALIEDFLNRAIETGQVREDLPVNELVWALHVLLRSLLLDWCLHPNQVSLRQRGAAVVELFLQGACARDESPDSDHRIDPSPLSSNGSDDWRTDSPCQNDLADPSRNG